MFQNRRSLVFQIWVHGSEDANVIHLVGTGGLIRVHLQRAVLDRGRPLHHHRQAFRRAEGVTTEMKKRTGIDTGTKTRIPNGNIIIGTGVATEAVTEAVTEVAKRVRIDPDGRNMKKITATVSLFDFMFQKSKFANKNRIFCRFRLC